MNMDREKEQIGRKKQEKTWKKRQQKGQGGRKQELKLVKYNLLRPTV